jgi:cation:H+ antiporter
MVLETVGVGVSLAALLVGGDQFVIGAARVAVGLRVRPTIVGVVIGGLGASLPVLIVSGVASVRRTPEIAVGNLVGSNIANISLALGVAALVAPVHVDSRTVRREAPLSVAAVLLFAVLLPGGLSLREAVVLVVALALAMAALLFNARTGNRRDELGVEVADFFEAKVGRRHGPELLRTLAGLALMLAGSEVLVRSATGLAERLGVGEEFIGLTVVGLGTSAPLVAIAVQAARRRDHDLVVGNVLGSNLFIALAGGAIVGFLHAGGAPKLSAAPVWLMAGISVAAWGFMARGSLVNRWEAGVLILAYGAMLLLAPH